MSANKSVQLTSSTFRNHKSARIRLKIMTKSLLLFTTLFICARLTSCAAAFTNNVQLIRLLSDQPEYDVFGSQLVASNRTPVVFWHGLGDTAHGSIRADMIALQRHYPGLNVLSIQIGDNAVEDELHSYCGSVNDQVDAACAKILSDPAIKDHGSFNAVGFSQGCQFLRGLIERCPLNEHNIKVKNFVSLGGQHQGVFGLPNCPNKQICRGIKFILTEGAYSPFAQAHIVPAQYWHDPHRESLYKRESTFLADINNELSIKPNYKSNFEQLDNLVLVKFLDDMMVEPRESSLFGFYSDAQKSTIVPMEETTLYKQDRIGLRTLHESNRVHRISIPGGHLQYKMTWFLTEIADKFLDN